MVDPGFLPLPLKFTPSPTDKRTRSQMDKRMYVCLSVCLSVCVLDGVWVLLHLCSQTVALCAKWSEFREWSRCSLKAPDKSLIFCLQVKLHLRQTCICAVTRGFQTKAQDLFVFPFLPRHYHMTQVLLLPFITTVWTPAIINII